MTAKIKVWDLPLRIFHWTLVSAVIAAFTTGELGGLLTDWHGRIGTLVLGLLIFRLIWGFIGSHYARFSSFFPTSSRISDYFKGVWEGHGHNPLGALSVLALLGALAGVVATGLFANDDIAFEGPLFALIDKDLSDRLTGWHELFFYILAGLVALHVAAIGFYLKVKKNNLVIPMVTGEKEVPRNEAQLVKPAGLFKFIVAATVSGFVVWAVSSGAVVHHIQPLQAVASPSNQNW